MLDEANAYERGMDDDLTFQTVRELAGTAYMAGRSAPPTDAEVEGRGETALLEQLRMGWHRKRLCGEGRRRCMGLRR